MAKPSTDPPRHDLADTSHLTCCPPLRVHHLLAWTVVSAISLTLFRESVLDQGFYAALILIGFSAGMTFVGFARVWACRGELRRSPGQGFLVFAGVWLALGFVGLYLDAWEGYRTAVLIERGSLPRYTAALLWNRFQTISLAMLAVAVFFAFARSCRWRVVYLLFVLAPLESVVTCLVSDFFRDPGGRLLGPAETSLAVADLLEQIAFLAMAFALLVAIFQDRRLRISRDWTHWSGIAFWCCFYLPEVVKAPSRIAKRIGDVGLLG